MNRFRFILPLGVFALLVAVLAIGIRQSPDKEPHCLAAASASRRRDFALPDLADPRSRVSSSAASGGHWYVFNVWGTWCVACRIEHAMLLRIKRVGPRAAHRPRLEGRQMTMRSRSCKQAGQSLRDGAVDRDGRRRSIWGVYGAPETSW